MDSVSSDYSWLSRETVQEHLMIQTPDLSNVFDACSELMGITHFHPVLSDIVLGREIYNWMKTDIEDMIKEHKVFKTEYSDGERHSSITTTFLKKRKALQRSRIVVAAATYIESESIPKVCFVRAYNIPSK
jgi:hypothetical protein